MKTEDLGGGKKVVVIGGGTGSFTVLSGLKKYNLDITAVVSTFDSGGSTGMLRDEIGMLPPGDIRRCLIALAEDEGQPILRQLFMHRFQKNSSLQGHSFGNLFLAALSDILGSEVEAIRKAAEILKIKGKVLPVSVSKANLCATLADGEVLNGENVIDQVRGTRATIKSVCLKPRAALYSETRQALLAADLIVIGPGDLYTSVIPNLLVEGMPQALRKSAARKVYVCNLMTKHGETDGYPASRHLAEILSYANCPIDAVICNSYRSPQDLMEKYAKELAFPVVVDADAIKKQGIKVIAADFASRASLVRHDPEKLAEAIIKLLHESSDIRPG